MYGYTGYKMIKKRTLYRHFALIYHKLELEKSANETKVKRLELIYLTTRLKLISLTTYISLNMTEIILGADVYIL